jgi:hypothetical protein
MTLKTLFRDRKVEFLFLFLFQACTEALQCGPELCFDETLYANRGRGFSFKQYMKAKPSKYGFLYKSLNDSIRAYTYRSHIYAGRPTLTPTEDYIQGVEETVVQTLRRYAAKNEVKGRNLTTDRFYTSSDLADRLLTEFHMTIVGTLNANRKGLPAAFKSIKDRKEGDYMALFEVGGKKTIHSWVTNTKSGPRNVMAMTTTIPILGKTQDSKEKPAVLTRYDNGMGGCDRMDQLMMSKTVRIKSRRWPMSTLAYMLDTARVNARTIGLIQNRCVVPDTRQFGKELVRDLVTPHIRRRLQMRGLQTYVSMKAHCYLGVSGAPLQGLHGEDPSEESGQDPVQDPVQETAAVGPKPKKTRRCVLCIAAAPNHKASTYLKKVSTTCRFCQKLACLDHLLLSCASCAEGKTAQPTTKTPYHRRSVTTQNQPQQSPQFQQLSAGFQQSATGFQQSATRGFQQAPQIQQPLQLQPTAAGFQQSATGFQQSATPGFQQSATPGFHQPVTSGFQQSPQLQQLFQIQQTAAGFQHTATGFQQSATMIQQSSQQHASRFQQSATFFQQPAFTYQQSLQQQPAAGFQQPAAGFQQPAAGFQQPATGFQQSATGFQQSAARFQHPAMHHAVWSEQTATPVQQSLHQVKIYIFLSHRHIFSSPPQSNISSFK